MAAIGRGGFLAVTLAILVCADVSAQSARSGWWARVAIGAASGSQLCDRDAASWSCSSRGSGVLGRFDLAVGRAVTPGLSLGLELSAEQARITLNPYNRSSLTIASAALVATFFPLPRAPVFLHVALGASGYRLWELNNDHVFIERGPGWNAGLGGGAEFRLAGGLYFGPFARFDYRELGPANVFFHRLQRRVLSLGAAFTIR